jgi:hypothetical protein
MFSEAVEPERRMKMKAKDLLTDESKWTQGAAARNKRGRRCDVFSDAAVRFCLCGAAVRVYSGTELYGALFKIARAIGLDDEDYKDLDRAIAAWNDDPNRTFEDVRKVLEAADV